MSRFMPTEWAPHSATWMGFPSGAYPGAGVSDEQVHRAWADVANLIADHEPVHMLCNREHLNTARKLLSEAVTLHEAELNDAWLRDIGPTWVIDNGQLRAVNWRFNGWGDNTSFDWQADAKVARLIANLTDTPVDDSSLTNEGGGIHVDGNGTVLLTETVQLDPDRNPGWDREQVEEEIHGQLGTTQALWFPKGLWRDYQSHGTRGHVDVFACFADDGSLLLHQQQDNAHPDAALYAQHFGVAEMANCSIRAVPAPRTVRDNIDWVDYSYLNHYTCNGAVILPTFDDPNDDVAAEILAEAWPGREIRRADARVIFAMGGGVHCITQQQPAV